MINRHIICVIVDLLSTFLFVVQAPPSLCMYYRWIETQMLDWSTCGIRERRHHAYKNHIHVGGWGESRPFYRVIRKLRELCNAGESGARDGSKR
jgi:hypothetical protein